MTLGSVAWQTNSNTIVGFIELVITSSFVWDVWLNFKTAFYDENLNLISDHSRIVSHYMMGWFVVDVMSIVPFDALLMLISGGGPPATLQISRWDGVLDAVILFDFI